VEYFNYLGSLITRDVGSQIQGCRGKNDDPQTENTFHQENWTCILRKRLGTC